MIKSIKPITFKFYTDAGHGWLAVKRSMLTKLGIKDKISSYSYQKGSTVYLEEDGDYRVFVGAYVAHYGVEPIISDMDTKDRSPIRNYERYKMEVK